MQCTELRTELEKFKQKIVDNEDSFNRCKEEIAEKHR